MPNSTLQSPPQQVQNGVSDDLLIIAHAAILAGRHFNQQASNLAKQGYMGAYPSSLGQEACQVAAALALEPADWLFPTYRDSVAVMSRGIDLAEVLSPFHGSSHCGYAPTKTHTAPEATPLATHTAHAVGLAMAAKFAGDSTVALAMCGDGSTSEGDFHEALNLAAVFEAPVVFLVQNNGYAISTPVSRQMRAASIAAKGEGYGMPAYRVDGNDFEQVYPRLHEAVERARAGGGPTLIEAMTYRMGPHTTSDNPDRYRSREEVEQWRGRDPLTRIQHQMYQRLPNAKTHIENAILAAEKIASEARTSMMQLQMPDPQDLFAHVYANPPATLSAVAEEYAQQHAAQNGENA